MTRYANPPVMTRSAAQPGSFHNLAPGLSIGRGAAADHNDLWGRPGNKAGSEAYRHSTFLTS